MDVYLKNQWYDGFFYGWFFDPIEGDKRRMVLDLIEEGDTVLDVCCGTGRLSIEMAAKCRYVTGVDISPRMLAFADKQKKRRGIQNLEFIFGDSTRLEECTDQHYDVAVVSLALHEMYADERHNTVCSMASVADRIIISDHTAPQPATIPGFIINQLERIFGGRKIYPLYKEYLATGGAIGVLERCGLTPDKQQKDQLGIRHVVGAVTNNG